uniref:Uncharacterized protein n=1 Tax=Oryza brachyantha TaxID=4533 RepID=J3N7N6_ORYBR
MAPRLRVLALAALLLLAVVTVAVAQADPKPGKGSPEEKGKLEKETPEPKPAEEEKPEPQKPEEEKKPEEEEKKEPKPEKGKPEEGETREPEPEKEKKKKKKPMKVKCQENRKLYPYCSGRMMECPATCPSSCYVDCESCKPVCVCNVPGACGDPRFIGGDGNAFYFHGRKDADFCLVSDRDLHINAHFIGKRRADGMSSRDFTWIQAIAVLFDGHRLYVGARKTATWDDDVDRLELILDGEPVPLPKEMEATWTSAALPALSVTRTKAANGVLVVLDGQFKVRTNAVPITAEDSRVHRYGMTADDCLAHLDLAFKFDALTGDVHGVVGQTYRSDYVNKFDVRASMPTMGGGHSFATSGLFAADCAMSRFGQRRDDNDGAAAVALAA